MEISIIIASLVSNLITKFVKPAKQGLSEEKIEQRKLLVRAMNAVFGLVTLVVTYTMLGGEIDAAQLSSYIEILVGSAVTFAGSQGWYFLSKK